jgi:hypothetical protein
MHKRIAVIIGLCFFSFFAISLSFAQESDLSGNEMIIAAPSPMVTVTPTPNYVMAYPGILPDSPLYPLKAMRDRVISFVIGNQLKKAEFDLLQSDKRIGAALMLIEKKDEKKYDLAISTLSKGLNYYEQAIAESMEAKKQGDGVSDMKSKLKHAGAMYIHMLQQGEKKTPDDVDRQIKEQRVRIEKLQKQVQGM